MIFYPLTHTDFTFIIIYSSLLYVSVVQRGTGETGRGGGRQNEMERCGTERNGMKGSRTEWGGETEQGIHSRLAS